MEMKDMIKKMAEIYCEGAEEEAVKDGLTLEHAKILSKRMMVLLEQHDLEEELDKYTHNKYQGIAEIMVELYEKQNNLLKECAEKCKRYLDENNLPYSQDEEEEKE